MVGARIICFVVRHDDLITPLSRVYQKRTCWRCGRIDERDLTDEARSKLRHYCPQCEELEEDCQCAMC